MSIKELLNSRYEVIQTYPGCQFEKGQTLNYILRGRNNWYHTDDYTEFICLASIEKYPHLFRKMKWWERRTKDQMPKKLKSKISGEVTKVKSWDMVNILAVLDENYKINQWELDNYYTPVD